MVELILDNYKVQTTGADGGHNYILTEIEYEGNKRRIVILFTDKSEEPNLDENKTITIIGEIVNNIYRTILTHSGFRHQSRNGLFSSYFQIPYQSLGHIVNRITRGNLITNGSHL